MRFKTAFLFAKRTADLTDDEKLAVYDMFLLTMKPTIYVANVDEDSIAEGTNKYVEIVKKYADEAPVTDLLPDINCALAWVQIKEFSRNEKTRKDIFSMYQQACLIGHHKLFAREMDEGSTACSFPLILASSVKDVKQYAARKDIEIQPAFVNSIIGKYEDLFEKCIHAKALLLRCVHIPLYPRLTHNECSKIVKVLSSLP